MASLVNLHKTRLFLKGKIDAGQFFTKGIIDEDAGVLVALLEKLLLANQIDDVEISCEQQDNNKLNSTGALLLEPPMGKEEDEKCLYSPLRVAKSHVYLRVLDGHDFNVYQAAFLTASTENSVNTSNMFQCIICALTAIGFATVVVLETIGAFMDANHFIPKGLRTRIPNHSHGVDGENEVMNVDQDTFLSPGGTQAVILQLASWATFIFFYIVWSERQGFETFRSVAGLFNDDSLEDGKFWKPRYQRMLALFLDWLDNEVIGWLLYVANFFFVISADTPIDALLNAIATEFILQVDSLVKPYYWDEKSKQVQIDWGLDGLQDTIVERADKYMTMIEPSAVKEEMSKTKVRIVEQRNLPEDVERNGFRFSGEDIVLFELKDKENQLVMKVEKADGSQQEVTFLFSGDAVEQMINTVSQFNCVDSDLELSSSTFLKEI